MLKLPHLFYAGLLLCATASAESTLDPFKIIQTASDHLAQASSLSVHVEKRFDVVLIDGAKVEYSGALEVLMLRPAGLFMDYGDDLSAKRVWYDGQSVTLLDTLKNLYVAVPVQGTVSEALNRIANDYGVEIPLAPILKKNLLQEVESIVSASYLGIHDAEGEPCHHLLFRGEHLDMQIWITIGEAPLLRKLNVTFWEIEGSPQQSLTFSDWNLEAEIDPGAFEPQLPEGALAIEMLPTGGE